MNHLLLIVTLALAPFTLTTRASLANITNQPQSGHVLHYPEAGFSVVLPLAPEVHRTGAYKLFNDAKIEEAREYALYRDRVIYVVRTYITQTPAKALSELEDYFTRGATNESSVTIDGITGRRWQTPSRNLMLFTTKNSIIVFNVTAREITHPDAQRFIASISLNNEIRRVAEIKNVAAPTSVAPPAANLAVPADQNPEILKTSELTQRVTIGYKPEPGYTESARRSNTQGTVKLRILLASDGTVQRVAPLERLPDGLTENAIAAARRIKFLPAEKDGRLVSTWAQIHYQFNIY